MLTGMHIKHQKGDVGEIVVLASQVPVDSLQRAWVMIWNRSKAGLACTGILY